MKYRGFIAAGIALSLAAAWYIAVWRESPRVPAQQRPILATKTALPPRDVLTPLPPERLDSALSREIGESHSLALDVLVDLARRHEVLSRDDAHVLLSFIAGPRPDGLAEAEWEERVNDILNALRDQPETVPGLTDFLLTAAEKSSSRILRLYAMQHLALVYKQEKSGDQRQKIIALFQRLSETSGEESAGAAVMFLNDLQREAAAHGKQVVEDAVITRAAVKLAADTTAAQDVRISALHTCADRRMTEVLPAARQLAANTATALPLRKAAIFTVSQVGSKDDTELLERLVPATPELHPAVAPALVLLRK